MKLDNFKFFIFMIYQRKLSIKIKCHQRTKKFTAKNIYS